MTTVKAQSLKPGDPVIYKLNGKKFKFERTYTNWHGSLMVVTDHGEYFTNELDLPVKEDKNTVTLYTALKVTGILDGKEDDLVYLRYPSKDPADYPKGSPTDILTLKQVREKYDMQKERVKRLTEYWCCGEYQGFLFVMEEHTDG